MVLNHLCTQSPKDNKHKYSLVTDFCKNKQSLIIIFRYAHVEDRCLSIIANVFSVLAALVTDRRLVSTFNVFMCYIQIHAISHYQYIIIINK